MGGRRTWIVLLLACALLTCVPGTAWAQDDDDDDDGPEASFVYSPFQPRSGATVTFTSNSEAADDDEELASQAWDFESDGQVDATGETATHVFARPGTYPVRLRVTDFDGDSDTRTRTVNVRNRAPAAGFYWNPDPAHTGGPTQLISSSADPDGQIASVTWDLDNDGAFDDAAGVTASQTFPAPGSYVVGVRATDDFGASAEMTRTVVVDPAPAAPPPSSMVPEQRATPALLDPFPIVRVRGTTTRRGVRLTLFTVRAPGGTSVRVRCKGRSCPFAKKVRRVPEALAGARIVRFRALERRLRAGTSIRVWVTSRGAIGKFTRFRIRRRDVPRRKDACLEPGSTRPSPCGQSSGP